MSVWACRSCTGKKMQHMGVPNHRAMHRRRKDGPVVMESETSLYHYDFRDPVDARDVDPSTAH